MKTETPKIEMLAIADIKPYENNPRVNDLAAEKVAESIKAYGFRNPIIIDNNGVVVCGHTRLKAAEKLGIKKVPCLRVTDLTEEQIKEFRLVDNKTSEFAWWDVGKLDIELADLSSFDSELFGFENVDFTNENFEDEFGEADVREDEELDKSKVTFDIPRDRISDVRRYRQANGDDKIVRFILECADNA